MTRSGIYLTIAAVALLVALYLALLVLGFVLKLLLMAAIAFLGFATYRVWRASQKGRRPARH